MSILRNKLLITTVIFAIGSNAYAAAPVIRAPLSLAPVEWQEFYRKTPIVDVAPVTLTYSQVYFINKTINYSIEYKADPAGIYQTPEESKALKSGDCEDYAILKWDALRKAGVHETDMEFVSGTIRNSVTGKAEFHTVLWYWPEGAEKPYYLDSNDDDIKINHLTGDANTAYNRLGVRAYDLYIDTNKNGVIDPEEAAAEVKRNKRLDKVLEKLKEKKGQ